MVHQKLINFPPNADQSQLNLDGGKINPDNNGTISNIRDGKDGPRTELLLQVWIRIIRTLCLCLSISLTK